MKLAEIPTTELIALHNRITDKAAGPKTFATRRKLPSFGQPKRAMATKEHAHAQADAADAPETTEKKPLARASECSHAQS